MQTQTISKKDRICSILSMAFGIIGFALVFWDIIILVFMILLSVQVGGASRFAIAFFLIFFLLFFSLGFGIASLILSFYSLPQSKMRLVGRIFSIVTLVCTFLTCLVSILLLLK